MPRKIAISQRVDVHGGERRDAVDQRWAAWLEELGVTAVLVPNSLRNPSAWAIELGISGLLLTGGNDLSQQASAHCPAPERDRSEQELLGLAMAKQWPVLGVCRGMQMVNVHLGGSISRTNGHAGTRHALHSTGQSERHFLNRPLPSREVNSFHNFCIGPDQLAQALVPLLIDEAGLVEAAEHDTLPWITFMWHPERESQSAPEDALLISRLFASTNRP